MPSSPKIPDAGIPIYGHGPHSMREVLADIAKHAGRSIDTHGPVGGIGGPGAVNLSAPEYPHLNLYRIAGVGTGGQGSNSGSGSSSGTGIEESNNNAWQVGGLDPTSWPNGVWWTYGQRCWWWVDPNVPVAPSDEELELIFCPTTPVTPAGGSSSSSSSSSGSGSSSSGVAATTTATWGPPYNVGDLVWCYFDEELGAWCVLQGGGGSSTSSPAQWFQCGSDQFVDGIPLGFLCGGLVGIDGTVQDPMLWVGVGGVQSGIDACFGNQGTLNQYTMQQYQQPWQIREYPYTTVDDPLLGYPFTNPKWSVILLDPTGQQCAMFGDWVLAQNTGLTATFTLAGATDPSVFQVWVVVGRASNQTHYLGILQDPLQASGGTINPAKCKLYFANTSFAGQLNLKPQIMLTCALLDTGQVLSAQSTVLCNYHNEDRKWWAEGAVCFADPGA